MSDLVPIGEIERIVGARRDDLLHWGRAVTSEETVYILHSRSCLMEFEDLRRCPFSCALDLGIDPTLWEGAKDRPVILGVDDGRHLVPIAIPPLPKEGSDGQG